MINVVYLVILFNTGYSGVSEKVMQANIKQCEVNKQAIEKQGAKAYCIVGVK